MELISPDAIKQLFLEARTFNNWQPKTISDEILCEIYELMKWAPTSANLSPARIVFVKSGPEKEKLISCLAPTNVEKVQMAPVTAIIAQDEKFYEQVPKLFPHALAFRDLFVGDKAFAESTAFRNSTLQGAYLIMAARALGLDCGPMSGFDNNKLDELFFANTDWKSNFICNIGYGDKDKLFPRLPRLSFEEACRIV